jgi:hypothetical protein
MKSCVLLFFVLGIFFVPVPVVGQVTSGTGAPVGSGLLDNWGYSPPVAVDPNLPVPRVSYLASDSLDAALRVMATKLDALFRSVAFQSFFHSFLFLCCIIGVFWQARGLIWGSKELGDVINWFFLRFVVGFSCFFVISKNAPAVLTNWINGVSLEFASVLTSSKTLSPGVQVRMHQAIAETDVWLVGAAKGLGDSVESVLHNNVRLYRDLGLNTSKFSFESTLTSGFPGLNYGVVRGAYNASLYNVTADYAYDGVVSSFLPPVPYDSYEDDFGWYRSKFDSSDYTVLEGVVGGAFTIRPVLSGFEKEGYALYQAGLVATQTGDAAGFYDALFAYRLHVKAVQTTYLKDLAAWYFKYGVIVGSNAAPASAGVGAPGVLPEETGSVYERVTARYKVALDQLEDGLREARKADLRTKVGGWAMAVLVPIALAIVGFYCIVSVYSIPIFMVLWSCLFFLPEELEFSGALKKGVNWILVLLLLPIFTSVVVDLAIGFVDVVRVIVMSDYIRPLTAGATGVAAGSLMPGSGWIGAGLKVAAGSSAAAAASQYADYNVFVWVSWIMAFIMIVGAPKILSTIVSGGNGFADALVQKAQMNAMMGGGIAAMSAQMAIRSKGGRGSDGTDGSDGASGGGGFVSKAAGKIRSFVGGRSGIGGLGQHVD